MLDIDPLVTGSLVLLPLREVVIDEEDGEWQVPSLIVGWQNDGVFVFGTH
jgi:hypothetical protein